jgi:hypothetical protein
VGPMAQVALATFHTTNVPLQWALFTFDRPRATASLTFSLVRLDLVHLWPCRPLAFSLAAFSLVDPEPRRHSCLSTFLRFAQLHNLATLMSNMLAMTNLERNVKLVCPGSLGGAIYRDVMSWPPPFYLLPEQEGCPKGVSTSWSLNPNLRSLTLVSQQRIVLYTKYTLRCPGGYRSSSCTDVAQHKDGLVALWLTANLHRGSGCRFAQLLDSTS